MSLMLLLSVLLVAGAVGVVVWTIFSQLDDRQVVRDALRQLDGYEVENGRDQQMLAPLKDRAVGPLVDGVTGLGRRFTPAGYVAKVRQKLIYAGKPDQAALDRFLAVRVISIGVAFLVFILLFVVNLLGLSGNTRLLVPGLLILALVLLPDSRLNREVEARQHEIQITLPDVMDLLTISVEAGLGFEQAIDRVVNSVPGALSDEFSRMLGETRAGASRSDAMRAMDERCNVPELRSFVMAIIQADQFGVSIGRVLRGQADEMRIKRRQLAQERAQKAPVKMLIPMVFCIFPALFVVVIGPAIMNIRKSI